MKKIKETLYTITIALAIGAVIYGAYRFNFYVWRLKHPSAPAWTYLMK